MTSSLRMASLSIALCAGLGLVPAAHAAIGPGDPPGSVAYLRSGNGGGSFTPMQLSDRPPSDDVGITHVEASGGTVHALFDNNLEINDENARNVLYRRSTNRGFAFSPSRPLDLIVAGGPVNGGDSGESDLETVGATVHVVWEDDPLVGNNTPDPCCTTPNRDDVFYTRSTNDGVTFSTPVNRTSSQEIHNRDPDVAADGNLVGIAYEGRDDVPPSTLTAGDDTFFQRSTNGGVTWGPEVRLTTLAGNQDEPAVEIAGTTVHVAMRNRSASPRTIAYVRSTDGGQTFSAPVNLPAIGAPVDTTPGILALGSNVYVMACSEAPGVNDLLLWRSADGGATFTGPAVVSAGPEQCNKPVLDGTGRLLHVVFERDVDGESDIFHTRSDDGGVTWRAARNVSDNFDSSADPSISLDPRRDVHVSWTDKTDFLFAPDHQQKLPLEEGGEAKYERNDVVRFSGAAYETVIDGDDVFDKHLSIDALAVLPPQAPATLPSFVLSFDEEIRKHREELMEDSDLWLFTPTSLGENTAGSLTRWFDGSDVGLEARDEDVDAVEVDNGTLYLSTRGAFALPGGLTGGGQDVFACEGFTAGDTSACAAVSLPFAGAPRGLEDKKEGVDAFSFSARTDDGVPRALFAFEHSFSVPSGASGDRSDIAACVFEDTAEDAPAPLPDCGLAAPLATVFHGATHQLKDLAALELEY